MNDRGIFEHGFIYGDVIDDDICDGLIDFFEEAPKGDTRKGPRKNWLKKGPGGIASYSDLEGDSEIPKKSLDTYICCQNLDPRIRTYIDRALLPLLDAYKKKFPSSEQVAEVGFATPAEMKRSTSNNLLGQGEAQMEYYGGSHFLIQKYQPKEGFFAWHCEKSLVIPATCDRALVFMTYLNDVSDGGTRFLNQDIITPAVKGLTLIWPTDWTHTHCGQISQNNIKYIATGWFSYKRGPKDFSVHFNKAQ